jgi:hypothetical protein
LVAKNHLPICSPIFSVHASLVLTTALSFTTESDAHWYLISIPFWLVGVITGVYDSVDNTGTVSRIGLFDASYTSSSSAEMLTELSSTESPNTFPNQHSI